MTITFIKKCLTCGEEDIAHLPEDTYYVGKESMEICRRCKIATPHKIIRVATMSDKLIPWMPTEGPPFPKGFFPPWPWYLLKPLTWM